jgi:hypothetical protein
MSTADEWAKREALREYGASSNLGSVNLRDAFIEGVDALAALLLSDEAVEVLASRELGWNDLWADERDVIRARVRQDFQAVLTKITEDKE